jgi:hypothetical protein
MLDVLQSHVERFVGFVGLEMVLSWPRGTVGCLLSLSSIGTQCQYRQALLDGRACKRASKSLRLSTWMAFDHRRHEVSRTRAFITVVQTRMNPPITHVELKCNDTSTLTDAFSDDATMKAANVRRVTVRLHVPLATLMARQSYSDSIS